MRWVVEVSSIGKTDLQQFCVEAESWQRALQAARAQRGEEGPMSGFSIELLEEGYRAVDPLARVRFVVKRAPDDMAITPPPGKEPPAPAAAASPKASPPRPTTEPANGGTAKPAEASAPSPPVGTALPGLPPVKLLTSREQSPSEASPLTYREYAFAVPAGTTEAVAVEVLRGQLKLVDAHLANAQMGKLVNLAVFDVEFTGRPPSPPLATLTWKDWKGEPVIGYPRRGAADKSSKPPASTTSPQGSVAPLFPPPTSLPPTPPAAPSPVAPPPAPAVAAPVAPPVAAPAAPAPASVAPPAPASVAPPAPATSPMVNAPKPASIPPAAPAPAAPAPAPAAQAPAAATTRSEPPRRPSVPEGLVRTPSGRFVRGRVTGDELITALFESMHDLHFLRDALDGGQFCLALATEVLPARAALIHFFDIDKREWVIACTRGKDTTRLLTSRSPESDEQLRDAARKRRATVLANVNTPAHRYQFVGGAKSVIIAPIMQAGRALGALEIINPLDGAPFTDDEGNAMTYIAEQYAEYLGSRGIVLDPQRIQAAAQPR